MDSPIAIIGTGRVGTAFALALHKRGARLVAVASRSPVQAEALANRVGGIRAVSVADLAGSARRILVAVSDTAIPQVAAQLTKAGFRGGAVLHTSGCVGPDALAELARCGVATGTLHPLQTFPTPEIGAGQLRASTFAIGGCGEALEWAREIVALLEGRALTVAAEHWALYHAAAVIASNYHATLLDSALECLEAAGISRSEGLEALAPLLEGTLRSILRLGPQEALTGPISRGDVASVRRNREGLKIVSQATRDLYDVLAVRTIEIMKRRGMPQEMNNEWKQVFR